MIRVDHRARIATCLTALSLLGVGLAACGSSSDTTASTSANLPPARTSTPKPTTTAPAKTTSTTPPATKTGKQPTEQPRTSAPTATAPTRARTAFANALKQFAGCLRRNGVNVPSPSTSGKNPLLSLKGLKTNTPQFRRASTKCRKELISALQRSRRQLGAG